jgi:hypothetical protein
MFCGCLISVGWLVGGSDWVMKVSECRVILDATIVHV